MACGRDRLCGGPGRALMVWDDGVVLRYTVQEGTLHVSSLASALDVCPKLIIYVALCRSAAAFVVVCWFPPRFCSHQASSSGKNCFSMRSGATLTSEKITSICLTQI